MTSPRQPCMDLYHLQSGSTTWITILPSHDIHFNEVCCPFPRWSVLVVNRTVYPGVVVTWLNPEAVWHLLEVNWVHYLIAISTGAFQAVLHANNKQRSSHKYRHRKRQITYIYTYIFFLLSPLVQQVVIDHCCQVRIANTCGFFPHSTRDLSGFHAPQSHGICSTYNEPCKYSARVKTIKLTKSQVTRDFSDSSFLHRTLIYKLFD